MLDMNIKVERIILYDRFLEFLNLKSTEIFILDLVRSKDDLVRHNEDINL